MSILIVLWASVFVAVGIIAAAHKHRQRRLSLRQIMETNQWFDEYFDIPADERKQVKAVLEALAACLSVHWTQLRPGDRFDNELRLAYWGRYNDDLEEFEIYINELLNSLKYSRQTGPPVNRWISIRDMLDWLLIVFRRC